MIISTTGIQAVVTLGQGTNTITLTHPQTYDLLGEDSPWDSDDLLDNKKVIDAAIADGSLTPYAPDHLKIYRYAVKQPADPTVAPVNEMIRPLLTQTLHPIVRLDRGDLAEKVFYEKPTRDATGELAGDNPIFRQTYIFVEDASGLRRKTSRYFFREDGSESEEIVLQPKQYSLVDAQKAGIRRRENVVNTIRATVVGYLAATETQGDVDKAIGLGTAFFISVAGLVSLYVEVGSTALASQIGADSTPWLDNPIGSGPVATIRDYVLEELS